MLLLAQCSKRKARHTFERNIVFTLETMKIILIATAGVTKIAAVDSSWVGEGH